MYIVPVVSEQEASSNSTHIHNLRLILNVQLKLTGKVLQILNLRESKITSVDEQTTYSFLGLHVQ